MINWSIQNVNRIVTVRKKGGSKPSLCFQKKIGFKSFKVDWRASIGLGIVPQFIVMNHNKKWSKNNLFEVQTI